MSELNGNLLDRWITGNYGEDQWEDHLPGCPLHYDMTDEEAECKCTDIKAMQADDRLDWEEELQRMREEE